MKIITTKESGIYALHLESNTSVNLILTIEYNGKVVQIANGAYRTIRYLWLAEPTRVIIKGKSACSLTKCGLTLIAPLEGLSEYEDYPLLPSSPTEAFKGVMVSNATFIATLPTNSAVTIPVPADAFILVNADKDTDVSYGGVIYRAGQGHVICSIGASFVTIHSKGKGPNTLSVSIYKHGSVSC